MKRFTVTVFVLAAAALGAFYAVFGIGLYADFDPGAAVSVPFCAAGKNLTRLTPDGRYEYLTLRGVDISSAAAGKAAGEFAVSRSDYLRWFGYIGEMGANAIRVSGIMDDDFYNALYEYNTSRESPLYLIQGVSVGDYENNNGNDAYGYGFYDRLIKDLKTCADVIHGRKFTFSAASGAHIYLKDVSPWAVGYLTGSEWVPDTVAYTDNNPLRPESFEGEFLYTAPGAGRFEAMLADVMDTVTSYETKKYKTQRPVGFISDPASDFLEYKDVYAKQLLKYVRLDAENVRPGAAMKAGCFAAYRLYDFCSDFAGYLTDAQTAELEPLLSGLNYDGIYGGYLELLSKYHSMPVIAAGYGFSSSRGAVRQGIPPLSERAQGEKLALFGAQLSDNGWAGGFISAWQDTWERRSWNTAYQQLTPRNYLWHDLQTEAQHYGLMAFDPGEYGKVCLTDGNPVEWDGSDSAYEYEGVSVYAKYDAQGLYLLVRGDVSPDRPLYLPIDTNPRTGSLTCGTDGSEGGAYEMDGTGAFTSDTRIRGMTFERGADFLLCLDGESGSRLLVQERYEPVRHRFWAEITGQDPYIYFPDTDSPVFRPINTVLANTLIFDEITPGTRALQRNVTRETGRLTHGTADPDSPDYNSLADFCYGDGLAEIRLPWNLLNFYDPSGMLVHDDYYERYGAEGIFIRRIYIGAAAPGSKEPVPMKDIPLRAWDTDVRARERLKQSYYTVKDAWRSDETRAEY